MQSQLFTSVMDAIEKTRPAIERTYANMEKVGLPKWTDKEQSFARACQKNMNLPEKGLAMKPILLANETTVGGGTDVGDISWVAPTCAIPASQVGPSSMVQDAKVGSNEMLLTSHAGY